MNLNFTSGRRMLALAVAAVALVAALTASAAPAQAANPRPWFWSTERAASVIPVVDHIPENCGWKIQRGWIGNCIAPDFQYDADCIGIGSRTIHQTDDVYLYKTFKCEFNTYVWTPAKLNSIYRKMAISRCSSDVEDPSSGDTIGTTVDNACVQMALRNKKQLLGGLADWFHDRSVLRNGTARVEVTGRFTALVKWQGWVWKATIRPDDGSGLVPVATG
jgi:hypothetical protein